MTLLLPPRSSLPPGGSVWVTSRGLRSNATSRMQQGQLLFPRIQFLLFLSTWKDPGPYPSLVLISSFCSSNYVCMYLRCLRFRPYLPSHFFLTFKIPRKKVRVLSHKDLQSRYRIISSELWGHSCPHLFSTISVNHRDQTPLGNTCTVTSSRKTNGNCPVLFKHSAFIYQIVRKKRQPIQGHGSIKCFFGRNIHTLQ